MKEFFCDEKNGSSLSYEVEVLSRWCDKNENVLVQNLQGGPMMSGMEGNQR